MGFAAIHFLLGLTLLEAQTTAPPGQGGHATPVVVRKEYDMRQLAAPPPLSESELAGRRLFVQRCGICHDPVGQGRTPGPWVDRETLDKSGEAAVRRIIAAGSPGMPGFQYALQPSQIDQIIAFLKKVGPEQKPKTATP
jgi:mono/diheme cytochrome c family protein